MLLVRTALEALPQAISALVGREMSPAMAIADVGAIQRVSVDAGETGEIVRLDHHITLVRNGVATLRSWHDGRALATVTARPGMVHVRPALERHRSVWDSPSELTVVALTSRYVSRCAADLFKRDLACLRLRPVIGAPDAFLWALGSRLDELSTLADPPLMFMDEIVATMAMHLLLIAGEQAEVATRQALPPAVIRRVSEHVDAHLARGMRLAELAALCQLSPFHFARQFRRETGISPARFVRVRRLQKADRLLCETTLAIEEIAALVGYADPRAFRRAFRAERGVTPSGFRNARP